MRRGARIYIKAILRSDSKAARNDPKPPWTLSEDECMRYTATQASPSHRTGDEPDKAKASLATASSTTYADHGVHTQGRNLAGRTPETSSTQAACETKVDNEGDGLVTTSHHPN